MSILQKRHENHASSGTIAGLIGNVMEWYDFALFGYFITYLSSIYFPSENEVAGLLASWGVFAGGFMMRPIGGVVFGHIGDRYRRYTVLLLSVILMAIPTFCLGILPTYAQIGIWAPILLVIIRIIQGLSVGGEFSGSVTYMVESASISKRGISGSWATIGVVAGMLLGSGMATAATNLLPESMVQDWGWRIPFIFGGVLGLFATFEVRKINKDYHVQREQKHNNRSPLKQVLTKDIKKTIIAVAFTSGYAGIFYLPMIYLPNYVHTYAGMPLHQAMEINTIATFLLLLLIPLFAWFSDKIIRRKYLLVLAFSVLVITCYPVFLMLQQATYSLVFLGQLIFSILIGFPLGLAPAFLVELFPTEDRLTGYSLTYNLGMGIVGGTTPMICTWLISVTNSFAPALYFTFLALITLIALFFVQDKSREDLQ